MEKRTKNIEEVKKLISKQKREEKIAQDALLFDPELRARQLDHIIEQASDRELQILKNTINCLMSHYSKPPINCTAETDRNCAKGENSFGELA